MRVLLVCAANRCRSPMAGALLEGIGRRWWAGLEVATAGFGPSGLPAVPGAVEAMAEVGIDLGGHRSRTVDRALVAGSDLVLTATRQQAVGIAGLDRAAWPRTFPLTDAVERADRVGDHGDGDLWVRALHGERTRASLLQLPSSADVGDPTGGPPAGYRATRDQLADLLLRLARAAVATSP